MKKIDTRQPGNANRLPPAARPDTTGQPQGAGQAAGRHQARVGSSEALPALMGRSSRSLGGEGEAVAGSPGQLPRATSMAPRQDVPRLPLRMPSERAGPPTLEQQAARTIQEGVRGLIRRREQMTTPGHAGGEHVKALMLNPAMGEAPSFLASSKMVGSQPFREGSAGDFNKERMLTRDAYRRVLETNVASVMLGHEHYTSAHTEKMQNTEQAIRQWVSKALGDVDAAIGGSPYGSPDWEERSDNTHAMLESLYGKSPTLKVHSDNDQNAQFANGLAQAQQEKSSDLAVSALRVAGLLQAVAWLAPTQDDLLNSRQNEVVRDARGAYDGDHPFFEGRGRQSVKDETARSQTSFKGIITSERAPLLDIHRLSQPATRAQTTNVPSHDVPQKPGANEETLPAWLKEPTARKMPFVNSISGLGMLAAIADTLEMLPKAREDKQDFYGLVAAAQLYFVGGHTFHEFLSGSEVGQGILRAASAEAGVVQEPDGINFKACLERIPSDVYEKAAQLMTDAAAQAREA